MTIVRGSVLALPLTMDFPYQLATGRKYRSISGS